MESWSFGSEGKAFLFSEEMDIPMGASSRSRKTVLEWDNNSCFNFDKESVESMGFMELGFPESVRKPLHGNQGLEILNGVIVNDSSSNTVASPTCLITPTSSFGEGGESWSKFSSPMTEFNSQDSSLIALKLGSLADSRDGQNNQHLKEKPKRAGLRGPYSHTPTCQVYGCRMDLSSSKDYHKRHRVCDAHSKTPTVIVNGIEQRFCQQCSRFHLLAEFDDAKRSCRRRLAGHNQRRRKPQIDTLNCKPHKLLRSCQGIFPGGILYPEEYEQANGYGHIKSEDESAYSQCVTSIENRQLVPKSFHGGRWKQNAFGSPSSGNVNGYINFDTPSSIQKVYGASNSSCALSLLSAQSHNLSGHSAGVHMPSPSMIHQSVGQMESIMVSDSSHTIDFQAHTDSGFQGSDCLSTKYGLSSQHGPTFDLLQLSSHLQRVEHVRNNLHVKQKNGEFYYFPTSMQATM